MFRIVIFLTLLGFLRGEDGSALQPEVNTSDMRIQHGVNGSIPQVMLLRTPTRNCSATLIQPQYILTAAHCLKPFVQDTTVVHGCDSKNEGCQETQVIRLVIHGDFLKSVSPPFNFYTHNIAVAKLAKPLSISPLKIAKYADRFLSGYLTLFGYSRNQTVQGKVINFPIEQTIYALQDQITLNGPLNEGGIDENDAGAPLVYGEDLSLYGIATQATRTHWRHYSFFMNVNYYRTFIEFAMQNMRNF